MPCSQGVKPACVREGSISPHCERRRCCQFRYSLIDQNLPEVAARFKEAIRNTVDSLRQHPLIGFRYQSVTQQAHDLRSWPVAGFEAIRIYYLADENAIHVIRVLHGKRDLKSILERERNV